MTDKLTDVEWRVAKLIAIGFTDAQIAQRLVAKRSVRSLVRIIQRKLKVKRAGIALYVLQHLPPDELERWRKQARKEIRKLNHVLTYRRAQIGMRIATPEFWEATNAVVARSDNVSMVAIQSVLDHLVTAMGSRIRLQVALHLAPINPNDYKRNS